MNSGHIGNRVPSQCAVHCSSTGPLPIFSIALETVYPKRPSKDARHYHFQPIVLNTLSSI